jgi:hemerythrin superfamily protein
MVISPGFRKRRGRRILSRGEDGSAPRLFASADPVPGDRRMEFLDWLKNEHQTVRQLLQKIARADERSRTKLLDQLRMELEVHHALEEKYLYPLAEGFGATKGLAEHAIEETAKTERTMAQLDPSDPGFSEQIEEFMQMIEDHVEEEEHELVPQLFEEVPADQQRKLVRKLQQAKKEMRVSV